MWYAENSMHKQKLAIAALLLLIAAPALFLTTQVWGCDTDTSKCTKEAGTFKQLQEVSERLKSIENILTTFKEGGDVGTLPVFDFTVTTRNNIYVGKLGEVAGLEKPIEITVHEKYVETEQEFENSRPRNITLWKPWTWIKAIRRDTRVPIALFDIPNPNGTSVSPKITSGKDKLKWGDTYEREASAKGGMRKFGILLHVKPKEVLERKSIEPQIPIGTATLRMWDDNEERRYGETITDVVLQNYYEKPELKKLNKDGSCTKSLKVNEKGKEKSCRGNLCDYEEQELPTLNILECLEKDGAVIKSVTVKGGMKTETGGTRKSFVKVDQNVRGGVANPQITLVRKSIPEIKEKIKVRNQAGYTITITQITYCDEEEITRGSRMHTKKSFRC